MIAVGAGKSSGARFVKELYLLQPPRPRDSDSNQGDNETNTEDTCHSRIMGSHRWMREKSK